MRLTLLILLSVSGCLPRVHDLRPVPDNARYESLEEFSKHDPLWNSTRKQP